MWYVTAKPYDVRVLHIEVRDPGKGARPSGLVDTVPA